MASAINLHVVTGCHGVQKTGLSYGWRQLPTIIRQPVFLQAAIRLTGDGAFDELLAQESVDGFLEITASLSMSECFGQIASSAFAGLKRNKD